MMKFNEMEREEREEIANIFSTWLKPYTTEIIIKVLEKSDEILSNEFAINMIKELHKREQEEKKEFSNDMARLLIDFDSYKEFNPHNHCLTHSKSYRDVLYDMYIKGI